MGIKTDLETATSKLSLRGYLNLPVPPKEELVSEIKRLKKKRMRSY